MHKNISWNEGSRGANWQCDIGILLKKYLNNAEQEKIPMFFCIMNKLWYIKITKKKATNIFAVATKKTIYSPHLELVSIYFSS